MKMSFYVLSGVLLLFTGIVLFIVGVLLMMNMFMLLMDWEIFTINSSSVVMTIIIDWMSMLFMSCVLIISSMVVIYSNSYMKYDMNKVRFLYLVLLFILSMMFMILSPNLISILLGWDGLGLVSYGLVIYFNNSKSFNAGMLTILTNRVGDVAILLGIGFMFNYGSWHYTYYMDIWDMSMYSMVILVILASFTKSAQIPFSSWLPAAMAAPTPVSALVHSSTLVTAGVYLLIRYSNVFLYYDCSLMSLLGMLTMFMAGLSANFEYDLKSIIALSTLSQLGLMVSVLFLGYPLLAFFHLLTHAFFSALLFLCAGLIIHLMSDSQDIRDMGGISGFIPYTCACFCISNISLCGVPFMSGFYSKDMILEVMSFVHVNFFVYLIFYISVGLTSAYTIRMMYYMLYGCCNMYMCQNYYEDKFMVYPMIFLSVLSVLMGSLLYWLMFLCPVLLVMSFFMSVLSLIFVLMGGFMGYMLNNNTYVSGMYIIHGLSWFMGEMWFMPRLSTYSIYSFSGDLSFYYSTLIDMGWGEYVISSLLYKYSILISKFMMHYQFNNVKYYMMGFIIMMFMFLI
uniref:NADH-ubiquinone oxidoreductase chain 5 n=1 Tax=Gorpis humeralis TaxID=1041165 RepID=K7NBE4_9HEMI|nr:NADH dehydrogenase subunit 5 [Gorpis humeralis]AEH21207.1 NADH dehydrogenase subunit 5 [Gorpis humeralis]